jgi:hypothetical protein
VFPRWYEIDGDTKEYIAHRKRVDTTIRQSKVDRARLEQENAKIKKDKAYDTETVRRALGNQGNKMERGFDGELRYNQTMVQLEKKVQESERRHLAKIRRKELKMARKAHEEAMRLNEVLALNKEANADKWDTEGNSFDQFRRLQEALGKGAQESSGAH